jgi:DNA-binding NtrC family response regulator
VPILVAELAPRIARRNGVNAATFSDGALNTLSAQAWPGNIRELINVLERLLILADGPEISEQAVRSALFPAGADETATMQTAPDLIATTRTFSAFRDEAEAAFLAAQLQLFGWNVTKTAEALEMPRSHLYTKIKRYGLTREDDN